MKNKELSQMMKEVKKRMQNKQSKSHKGIWIGIAITVIAALVGIILWIRSKNDEDIEEYYEYFDDEINDELDEELDEDLYGEDDVEYFEIKNFGEEEAEAPEASETPEDTEEIKK